MAEKRTYLSRVVVKAMGVFSGVQALNILCSVVRCKLVAMWIGPAGIGLFAIWNSALDMINTATNLGVRSSSVRDISADVSRGDRAAISRVVTVVRRWSLWLGVAGALLTMAFAPLLSRISFGDDRHVFGFVALSVAVFVMSLSNGEQAILQGTSMLARLAKATASGTVAGLVISVPLFYFLRVDSVLLSVIVCAVCSALFAFVYRNREYPRAPLTNREVMAQGRAFVRLGIFMTVGALLALVSNYAFVAYLNWQGGEELVGYYQASYTLANKYVGLVLAALGMEYYPRLSRVATSRLRLGLFTSQEINITLAVLTPMVMVMILLRQVVVHLLYTPQFEVVFTCLTWMLVGMVLRAISWCMSFVILAKGDGKAYIVTESLSVAVGFALNVIGYSRYGLAGLGFSFVLWYVIYNVIVAAVIFGKYKMRLHRSVWGNMAASVALSVACAAMVECGQYAVAVALAAVAIIMGFVLMRKHLHL